MLNMRGIRRFLSIANKTLAVVAGIGLVQMLTIASSFSQSSNPRSLDELYKIRDRLITELEQPDNPSPEPTLLSRLVPAPPILKKNCFLSCKRWKLKY